MSNQLYSGQGRDINVFAGQSLAVSSITGAYTATIIAGAGIGTALATDSAGGATYGPYSGGVTVRLKSGEGGLIDYEAAVSPVLNYAGPARLGYSAAGDTSSVVDGDGNQISMSRIIGMQGSPSSVTGTTAETILYSLSLPVGALIAGDILRIEPVWTYTNSANNKILAAKIGPTLGTAATIHTRTRTTTAYEGPLLELAVRTLSTQIQLYNLGGSYGGGTAGALNTHAVNFSVDNTLYVTGALANSGETIALEAVKVTLYRS